MMPLPAQISDAPFEVGEAIADRYVIERAIAEGGMGIVLAARHFDLDEVVAIKFLKPEFARQPEIIGRFAREAKAVTRIKSEYVAKVLDVGVSQTRGPFIVMEYLEGEDLSEQLAGSGRIPYERAVELILQTCEALAQAHALGIIHRDIKPENLFVVKNDSDVPTLKVLDFGVSKTALTGRAFGNEISITKTQTLMGTPLYMAPEQLRGQVEVDARSEVWAVGAVLYELLTGDPPFTGQTVTEVCASVLETLPPPTAKRAPEVPAELDAVISKCLEKTASNRYGTIAELAIALQPFGPKRARMCVERALAAAKGANQVPATLQSGMSLIPPSGPPSMRTPGPISVVTTAPSFSAPSQNNRKTTMIVGAIIGVLVVIAGISFAAKSFTASKTAPDVGAALTAAAAPLPAAATVTGTGATNTILATDPTTAATPSDKALPAVPATHQPGATLPTGGFKWVPVRSSAAAPPSVAKTASASAPPANTPSAAASPASNPMSDAKKSAIDDRK